MQYLFMRARVNQQADSWPQSTGDTPQWSLEEYTVSEVLRHFNSLQIYNNNNNNNVASLLYNTW
jgi:hypothetical protein